MLRRLLTVLIPVMSVACAPKYYGARELDRAIFRRQDSSFVNQALDELVRSHSGFFSLIALGIPSKEILVTRGDSASLYQAMGVYITYQHDKAPDICNPPSYAALMGWRVLPNRTGIEAVSLMATGDSAGMRDTFSIRPLPCGGAPVTLHHPLMTITPIIGRQWWRPGQTPTGRGTLSLSVASAGTRPCPKVAERFLASQNTVAECRETVMRMNVLTSLPPRDALHRPDTLTVVGSVPALHIWIDCRGPGRSRYMCPTEYPPLDPEPYQTPHADRPVRPNTLSGVIRDLEDTLPIPHARVRFNDTIVVTAEQHGRYFAAPSPGKYAVRVDCPDGRVGVAQDSVRVQPYFSEVDLVLPRRMCVRPELPPSEAVFEGIYDSGLERSEFSFCGNRRLIVWAEFTDRANRDKTRLLPALRGKETSPYNGFVWRVKGSLSGPGRYGPSASKYQLLVREVLEIRVQRLHECQR